nr:MAG TPA: hypothetical protein [Crassvirales sp.]
MKTYLLSYSINLEVKYQREYTLQARYAILYAEMINPKG